MGALQLYQADFTNVYAKYFKNSKNNKVSYPRKWYIRNNSWQITLGTALIRFFTNLKIYSLLNYNNRINLLY